MQQHKKARPLPLKFVIRVHINPIIIQGVEESESRCKKGWHDLSRRPAAPTSAAQLDFESTTALRVDIFGNVNSSRMLIPKGLPPQ
jgi:hypothetical protein